MAQTAVQGFRLSPQQRRLWALAKEAEGAPYRAEATVRIDGPLDRARLETALGEVVARHEILRTVFPVSPGMSRPAQVIQPPGPVRLSAASGAFRPDEEPPFAAVLVPEGPESHRLNLAVHAFVADPAALEVIIRNLARAYAGRLDDEPPAQYADVAEALNELLESDETEAGRELWREERVLPARDASTPFRPQWISLGLETSAPAAVLLAAWRTVLWRLGMDAAALGVEFPGRHYEGFDAAVGPFARFLPVRLPVADGLLFAELVERTAGKLTELEDWQDYFFPEGGFLPAGFRFAEPADPEPAGSVRFEVESARGWTERFELLLSSTLRRGGLALDLGYDASRFTEEEALQILEAFRALLENADPTARLGDLELTRPEERERLLQDLAGPAVPIPPMPVHRLILEQAGRTPDAVALSGEDGIRVTYGELAERARALAAHLQNLGVGPETRVGLCADRSPEMIVGLLAILEAGGAWVPLDPSYPAARLDFMLGDSRAPVLLIQKHLRGRFEAAGVEIIDLTCAPFGACSDSPGWKPWAMNPGRPEEPAPLPPPTPRVSTLGYPNTALGGGTDESAAYVLYTSGSTGTPKGVVVRHRALTNQILWMLDAYPLRAGDRVLQKTPSSFDASVWEILAPLAAGAELVLAAPGAHRDPVAMGRVLREREVTALQVVPALLRLLLDGGHLEGCPSLARLFCGGEPLTEDLRERVHRLSDTIELINLYGPTETTVQVTSWVAERQASDRAVPVGRPVHNARIYLLDPWGRLVPAGLPGEIWIGGVAPARGYLDRPELTADSFRPDPFSGEPGARMYRSGDLGRLRTDGALEFLGRLGGQNKIRGYRFDPGEIEAALRAHESVRDAVVLVREDRLVAYVAGTPSLPSLRASLAERLPDYLVPTDFVVLPALPLSPSGKVDRSALPLPEEERPADTGSVAPRTPLEEILAEIWAGLLGRERVGVHDDFFELGGHSLLGAQLVARVRDALGVEISLRNVFEAPTVAGLGARVEEAWRGEGPAVPPLVPVPREPGEALPLSFAQQRLWFLDRLAPGSAYYNVPSAVRFTGDLDERALAASFNEIVRLHETLRTTFRAVDGRPVQTASPSLVLPMPVVDLSGLSVREAEVRRLALEEAQRPFDLATGPLARLTLLRLAEGERVLLTTLHHIVSDAWSVGVLYRSLLALYAAFAEGMPSPLSPPPVQYADYAVWQRERFAGEAWERELLWWAGRLADLPTLRLPADRPRPPRQTFRGAGVTAELPGELAARLRAVARERGATLFMVLLAGFQALLHRITAQEEIVLGSPVANRERSEVEGLIGFFVNTLVLRTDVSGSPAFTDLLARARETALGAWAHQSLPFERLVEELQPERDLSRQPLFQVMFHLQNVPLPDFGLPGVTVEPLDVDPGTAPFDLGVDLLEVPDGLLLVARYATDLFDHTSIVRLVDRYARLLEAVAADPARRVGEIALLSEPERHQLLAEWNDTETAVEPVPVHGLVAAQSPEAVAVVFEGEALTYGELDRRVQDLAGRLRDHGVKPGVPVGVRMERSPEMAIAVLAIFEAGGVFVPLDPDAPPARQKLIEEDAFRDGGFLLTSNLTFSPLPGRGNGVVGEGPGVRAGRGETSPAYLLFTSGTSGRPKGVLVEHGSLSNLLQVSRAKWDWNTSDRMAVLAAETFDVFLWELLLPLVSGGTAILFSRKPALDVDRLVAALPALTRLHAVPALMREIVERVRSGAGTVPGLRTVYVGGDRVTDELVTDLRRVFPEAEIVVLYGPTEGTILATSHRARERSLLGRPLGNVRVTVRDAAGHLAPIGVPGEIVLGGIGVARGYLGRDELTRERFLEVDEGRAYRTGDLGRWLADGPLEFLGRLDRQAKAQGVRSETRLVDRLPPTSRSQGGRGLLPTSGRARPDLGHEVVPPRTPAEEILAGLWAEVLGIDRVGATDDFFALGGHSLLAVQVVSRIRQAFGVEVELRAFFETPTVAGLAARIETAAGPAGPPIVPRTWEGPERPLSFAQRRLWFLDRLEPGRATYNMPSALRVRGPLDLPALAAAFDEIARRHEVLRERIVAAGEGPVALVDPPVQRPLPLVDLSALPAREAEARRLALEESRWPFDLETGPLFRTMVLRLRERDHALLWTIHHAVSDGWSEGVLAAEVAALYAGNPLPPLPVRYADFAVWHSERLQGEELEARRVWWREQLAGAPTRLDLPTDRPRPAVASGRGRRFAFRLPESVAEGTRALGRREGVTPFMALLAAFAALLGRFSRQEDLLVGAPVAGRRHAEVFGLVGFFIDTLVLRADLSGDPTGRELLARVRETALGAWAHQDLPFERLVEELAPERDLGRQPLVQAVLQLQNVPTPAVRLPGLVAEPLEADSGVAPFDLGMDLLEIPEGLAGSVRYATDLFDETTVRRMVNAYERLLTGLAADPGRRIAELALVSEAERHQLLTEWNDTAVEVDAVPVHRLVAARAAENPEAPAVIFEGETVTYGELVRRVGELAGELWEQGVTSGTPVGLRTERSLESAVAVLAIFEAGGVLVSLDPNAPPVRQEMILEDAFSEGGVLLTSPPAPALTSPALLSHHADPLPGRGGSKNEELFFSPLPGRGKGVVGEGPGVRAGRGDVPEVDSAAPAYLLYTSGTSGRPKGVLVDHGSLSNLLQVTRDRWAWDASDRMPVLAAETFDVFLWELLLPLVSGGMAVLVPRRPAPDVDRLVESLPGFTRLHAVPALLREIVDRIRPGSIPGLRTVFVGGDRVPDALLRDAREAFPGAEIVVLYGPTEGTILATSHSAGERSLLGRPLGNVSVRVLEPSDLPAPIGVPGEIVLGGAGVARGYLHLEELTRERFGESDGERIYRTGDLGRWLPDGALEFLGRLDQQVKVRGVRVEPGEVEAALLAHPAVRQAAVLTREEHGGVRLEAWIAVDGPAPDLRAFLRARLPEALIPSILGVLPELPLTSHGKVDRAALALLTPSPAERTHVPLRTPVEEVLAGIWSEVLGIDRVGADDDFFALSGHSLLATQVAWRIRKAFGVDLPLRRLFERTTLAELAAEIEAASGTVSALPIEPAPRGRPLPASLYQEWLWRVQRGPVSALFNMPSAFRLRGPLDLTAMERALTEIVRRHESLRSRLVEEDGALFQEPAPAAPLPLPVVDLGALAEKEEELHRLAVEEAGRPFDVGCAPLIRACAVRLDERDHALLVTMHHAASDGWSIEVFKRGLAALYAALSLPELPVQYADFATWQRRLLESGGLDGQLAYWKRRLADLPEPLDLPGDRPRPARVSPRPVTALFALPADGLRALARETGSSLAMVLTAGLAAWIHEATGREKFTLASVFSGRTRPELSDVMGFFMNTVVLRMDLSGAPTLRDLLPRVRETVLAAYANQDVPFPRVMAELFPGETDRTRLVRVAFNMLGFLPGTPEPAAEAGSLAVETFSVTEGNALYDLALFCRDGGDAVYCQLIGAADLFDPETVERIGRDLVRLLTHAVAAPAAA